MPERAWRLVALRELPNEKDLPDPEDGVTPEEREEARAELREDGDAVVELPGYPSVAGVWRNVRRFFGITAFGVAASEARAGDALIWPHRETPYGHEELYLVVDGRVRFHCDGEEVEAGPGGLLYCPADVVRGAVALETPTVLFMVGARPGTYEPPVWAEDWRPPAEWLATRRS